MAVFLSGCAGLSHNFDCPMKSGIRCESLDQVNAQIDHGEIGNDNLSSQRKFKEVSQKSMYSIKGEPLRYGENVQRIWIAPFEDTAGNYHQASEVFVVTKPGHWIGNPPKETNTSEG